MFLFLIPLLLGFASNSASAFTTFFSNRLGARNGKLVCIILRDVIGIPALTIGYALAAITPSDMLFNPFLVSSTIGWLLILSGGAIIITALVSLSWRSVAPTLQDTLVLRGLYAYVRHPIYTGMFLELIGLFLWVPTLNILVACVAGIVWLIIQAQLEEIDLLQRIPAYKAYLQRVPRFFPRVNLR